MTNIWTIGQRYNWFVSNTAVASSIDGQLWQFIADPFERLDRGTCISINNSNCLVATSADGNIAYSTDQQTWKNGSVGVENFYISGTICTNKMIVSGRRHYTTAYDNYDVGAEVAQIFDSLTGEPDTWAMIFSTPYTPSGFNNIRYFSSADIGDSVMQPVCVAVGDKFGMPFACYSKIGRAHV